MYGDYSRWTFDPDNNHAAVLVQQGQPLTDGDWNEQAMIAANSLRAVMEDLYGDLAGFKKNSGKPSDFRRPEAAGGAITIDGDYIYVRGIRVDATAFRDKDKASLLKVADGKFWNQQLKAGTAYQIYFEAAPAIVDKSVDSNLADPAIPVHDPLRLRFKARVGMIPQASWIDFTQRGDLGGIEWELRTSSSERTLYRVEVVSASPAPDWELSLVWTKANARKLIALDGSKPSIPTMTKVLVYQGEAELLRGVRTGHFVTFEDPTSSFTPDQRGTAAAEIESVDVGNKKITLKKQLEAETFATHIRIWDGKSALSKTAFDDPQKQSVQIIHDAGVTVALKNVGKIANLGRLQPGDSWLLSFRDSQNSQIRFLPRSAYFAPTAKIDVAGILTAVVPQERNPPLASTHSGGVLITPANRTIQLATVDQPLKSFPVPAPAIAFDLTLRHLAGTIKTPQLKQWLHSATLPEVWGLGLATLRDRLLSCFPKPPADNAQFEEDLRRVIQDSDVIAQRLNYRGTESDSQFA